MSSKIAACANMPMVNRDLETIAQGWRDFSNWLILCMHYVDVEEMRTQAIDKVKGTAAWAMRVTRLNRFGLTRASCGYVTPITSSRRPPSQRLSSTFWCYIDVYNNQDNSQAIERIPRLQPCCNKGGSCCTSSRPPYQVLHS